MRTRRACVRRLTRCVGNPRVVYRLNEVGSPRTVATRAPPRVDSVAEDVAADLCGSCRTYRKPTMARAARAKIAAIPRRGAVTILATRPIRWPVGIGQYCRVFPALAAGSVQSLQRPLQLGNVLTDHPRSTSRVSRRASSRPSYLN